MILEKKITERQTLKLNWRLWTWLCMQYIWWPGKVKLCTMCECEFTIHNLQSTIHNSQSTIHNLQFTVHNLQSTIHNPQSTIYNTQSTAYNPQSAIHPQSTIHKHSPQSTNRIYNSRYKLHKMWTTIDNLQSAIHNHSIRSDTMMIYYICMKCCWVSNVHWFQSFCTGAIIPRLCLLSLQRNAVHVSVLDCFQDSGTVMGCECLVG